MKHSKMAMLSIIGTLAIAPAAMAQQNAPASAHQDSRGAELGRVVQGNTTIVFAPADPHDLDLSQLRTWNEFAEAHPKVARALAYNNSLMSSRAYLSKHPELSGFFQQHPDIKEAMAENPGNFVAIPPRPGE